MWPFSKKTEPASFKKELNNAALKRLRSLKTKNNKRYKEEYFNKLATLFRKYLYKRYKIKKGLIHEELSREIKSKRINRYLKIRLIKFSAEINGIEYGNGKLDKNILDNLIKQFEKIIK